MKITIRIEKLSLLIEDQTQDLSQLPPRVQKVAKLWAQGKTCSEISNALGDYGDCTGLISAYRKSYPNLFPYRSPGSAIKRNGAHTK